MRQDARFLIGPLVGVAVSAAALTGCGSSDIDSVVSPPTSEATATSEAASTTEVAESATSITVEVTSTTIPTTSATTPADPTPAPTTAAPTLQATPAPRPPAITTQELAALEAELTQIDAILAELSQNFAAD